MATKARSKKTATKAGGKTAAGSKAKPKAKK